MDILIISLVFLLMAIGLAGTIIPFVPGSPFIFAGALLYAWHTNFNSISWGTLLILLLLVVASQILEYLASLLGAKHYGAGKWGIIGAFIGGLAGLFLGGIVGIIIGPFLGAVIFERLGGREMKDSLKIGFGTLVGFIGGAVGKFILGLIMVGIFLIQVVRF
jgi:uncharacterized protein YqgC (DUF456 family)